MMPLRWLCLLIVLAGAVGCGKPERCLIRGKVTVNGTPVEQGTIDFRPAQGAGPTAGALITNGRYEVRLSLGEMRVAIQSYRTVGEQRAMAGDPDSPMIPKLEPMLPASKSNSPTLTLTVTGDNDHADFALE